MKKGFLFFLPVLFLMLQACGNNPQAGSEVKLDGQDSIMADSLYAVSKNPMIFENIMDTLLPYFAKLHDSIPEKDKFLPIHKEYLKVHRVERELKGLYLYAQGNETIFMLSRLEPSIKRDKYSVLCAGFQRDSAGAIDTASYREYFWSWKMRKNELNNKAAFLFLRKVNGEDMSQWYPENSGDEFIMFPDQIS